MAHPSPPSAQWWRPSRRLLVPALLLPLAFPSRITSFAPPNTSAGCSSRRRHSHGIPSHERSTAAAPPGRPRALRFASDAAAPTAGGFRATALFARGRGRPKKDAAPALEEEDDGGLDYEDEDDTGADVPEEEEVVDEDVEIGIGDDEEEEDEDEIEFEYDEEELEEELDEEEFDEGEYADEADVVEAVPATNAEVWASYDAAEEEPTRPLLDDVESDPHYRRARDAVLSQVEERRRRVEEETRVPRSLGSADDIKKALEYMADHMTEEEREEAEEDPVQQEVDRLTKDVLLTEEDLEGILIEDEEGNRVIDPQAIEEAGSFADDRGVEAFPSSSVEEDGENLIYPADGSFNERDLAELDDQVAALRAAPEKFMDKAMPYAGNPGVMDEGIEFGRLPQNVQDEIDEVMMTSDTMACPEPLEWLIYDHRFNVTNLILASFKHNAKAPIMFTQWMPQLEVYERYADQKAKEFRWTWDDVETADMDELRQYYKGIGYDEIPIKEPSDVGVVTLDTSPMDDEERQMLALENWMDEVYDPDEDFLHDDPDFKSSDNPFDPEYQSRSAPKQEAAAARFKKDMAKNFERMELEFEDEEAEKDWVNYGEDREVREDPEAQAAFRGWLVVACSPEEEDLDDATRIATRCEEEFGQAVVVETRVLGHARKEDNVFEVWMESFEIDLLHSRRQAFINPKVWTGPGKVDEKQLEFLVENVRYLISDEARSTIRYDDEFADIEV